MKKMLMTVLTTLSALAVLAMSGHAQATGVTMAKNGNAVTGYLANESALTYDKSFILDSSSFSIDRMSVEVMYGSYTGFTTKYFANGSQATGQLTVLSTTGLSGVSIQIGSVKLVAGTDYNVGATPAATADNIVSSANATGLLKTLGLSIASDGNATVYTTTTLNGYGWNFYVSNFAKISTTPMTGGSTAAFSLYEASGNSDALIYTSSLTSVTPYEGHTIYVPSHGYTTALPVLLSTTAVIGGLGGETTYYVIVLDSDHIALATTSARAQAGLYATILTTTTQVTANTMTLAPLALAGTPTFAWSVSNDGTNYFTHPSSGTTTLDSYTYPYKTNAWDIGAFNYRFLKLAVVAPTAGGMKMQAIVHGKQVVPSNR